MSQRRNCLLAEFKRDAEGLGHSGLEDKMTSHFQYLQWQKILKVRDSLRKKTTPEVWFHSPLLRP